MSNLVSICCRIAPCLSDLPFWKWASGLMVVARMLWLCRKVMNSSLLSSEPASTNNSPGIPAQDSHMVMSDWITASVDLDGAMHAAWKLVPQSITWYIWKVLPWELVHVTPSMEILSLKSRSSFKELGRACFGSELCVHTEHWKCRAALTSSGRNPCWSITVLIRSGLGWPMFLWIFDNKFWSSFDSVFTTSGIFVMTGSFVRGVMLPSEWDWGLSWGIIAWGTSVMVGGLLKLGLVDCSGLASLVSVGLWPSGLDTSTTWLSGLTSGDDAPPLEGTSGLTVSTASRVSPGLAANAVILILQACDGRTLWRLESSSQFSHSSSTKILLVPLLRNAHLRQGASCGATSSDGAMVRFDPRQAMTNLISLSGNNSWSSCMIFSSRMCSLPTLANFMSIMSNTFVHASKALKEDCFPLSFRRFACIWSVISDDRDTFGIAWVMRRRRFKAGSLTRAVASLTNMTDSTGFSRGYINLHKTLAISLANFLGYISEKVDRFIRLLFKTVEPSMVWWTWFPGHFFVRRCSTILDEVDNTVMPFRMKRPFSGSFKSPAMHMSKSTAKVCWWTSCKYGNLNMHDALDCSQCMCLWWDLWNLRTISPKATCSKCCIRSFWSSSQAWRERLPFNVDQPDHGPHDGENQTCSGLYFNNMSKSNLRPSVDCKSHWAKPKRSALPPRFRTCVVSWLFGPQNTSSRLSRWRWCIGWNSDWQASSSLENFSIRWRNLTRSAQLWVESSSHW